MGGKTNSDNTERFASLLVTLIQGPKRGLSRRQLRHAIDGYRGLDDHLFDVYFGRDLEDLAELGVKIHKDASGSSADEDYNGSGTLYSVDPEQTFLPKITFTPAESLALSIATRLWTDPKLGGEGHRALARLPRLHQLDATSSRFAARLTVREQLLAPLTRAAHTQSGVSFRYRRVDGAEAVRRVVPWGLGQRFGLWYLIAFDVDRQAERVFRLSRIVSRITEEPLEHVRARPDDFSPAEYLEQLSPERSLTTARVLLAPGRGQDVRRLATETSRTEDGYDVVTYQYHDADAAAARLAMLGPAARVVEPASLRDSVIRRLRGALEAQSAPAPSYTLKKTIPAGRSSGTLMAARALSIVAYVQQHGAVSRADLCQEFGITETTLTSDLKRISFLGPEDISMGFRLDVDYEADPVQISVPPEFDAPLTLSLNEALVVVVGLRLLAASEDAQTPAASSALTKLKAATKHLPVLDAIDLRPRADDDSELSRTLREAVHDRTCLHVDYYHPGRDEVSGRIIEPVQVLESGHVAYVLAYCRERQALRVFRHDRIFGYEALDETFTLADRHEPEVDLAEGLYAPREDDAEVVLAFADHLEELFRDHSPRQVAMSQEQPKRFIGQVALAGRTHVLQLIAEHGGDVVVTEPQELVAETVQWLSDAHAHATDKERT